jgi:hypothetical protein
MLDARDSAAGVAAAHEWWKDSVSGPLTTSSVGRWRREMSADAQRFAELHLAGFLREHGYHGARDAKGELAVVPGADGVGPGNEQLLVELARRDTVVLRPAPSNAADLFRLPHGVFLGVRGQLDPGRGQPWARRVVGSVGLVGALILRRLQRRPVMWVRRATLRERQPRDAVEVFVAVVLRSLARQVSLEDVWEEWPIRV